MTIGIERLRYRAIEGLRCGRFPGKVNTTVVLYRRGSTLIDTGPPNQWPVVAAFAAEHRVELVLATHHHEDHSGNLGRLGAATGAPMLAPAESLGALAGGFRIQPYRRLVWGVPPRVEARPLPAGATGARALELPDGGRLEPVLLPGHSPDMTCLLDPQNGVLFGADLYVSRRLRYLRADEDLPTLVASLLRSLELDFEVLLCSHRGVLEDGKHRLRQKIDSLVSLAEQAAELADRGWSARRITRRLLGREDRIGLASLGHYSKANLIRGCLELAAAGTREPGVASSL